jgi:hypothetical protein
MLSAPGAFLRLSEITIGFPVLLNVFHIALIFEILIERIAFTGMVKVLIKVLKVLTMSILG